MSERRRCRLHAPAHCSALPALGVLQLRLPRQMPIAPTARRAPEAKSASTGGFRYRGSRCRCTLWSVPPVVEKPGSLTAASPAGHGLVTAATVVARDDNRPRCRSGDDDVDDRQVFVVLALEAPHAADRRADDQ